MAFPKSVRTAWVVQSLAKKGANSADLKPFQFGIFGHLEHKALDNPTFTNKKNVYFAVGSPNVGPNTGSTASQTVLVPTDFEISFKSLPIWGHNIDKIHIAKPVKEAKPWVGFLGYDGLDASKTLKFECGKSYEFEVVVSGRAARSLYGRDIRETIQLDTDCCDQCDSGCADALSCRKYTDMLIDKLRTSQMVSRFAQFEKVMSCTPADTPTLHDCNHWCITLCDNGDESALAAVQTAVDEMVMVKDRQNGQTTYEIVNKSAAAPADYVQTDTVIPDCGTCPAGFTKSGGGHQYIVEVDDDGTSVPAVAGVWTGRKSIKRLSFEFGTSKYLVVMPNPFSQSVLDNGEDGIRVVEYMGVVEATCTQDTPLTVSWVACGVTKQYERTLRISFQDSDCNASQPDLTALTESLASRTDIQVQPVLVSTNGCTSIYEVVQLSKCVEAGCETTAIPEFETLPSFRGAFWKVVEAPIDPTQTCLCGIKVTSAFYLPETQGCAFSINDARDYDPLKVYIQAVHPAKDAGACEWTAPTWVFTQEPTFRQLSGQEVLREIIKYRYYRNEMYMDPAMPNAAKWNAAEGLKYGVDVNAYYYAISVYHNVKNNTNVTASEPNLREEIVLYVKDTDLATFKNLKELIFAYTSSNGVHCEVV